MGVHAELLVGSDVEEPAGGVIRPCCERVTVREIRYSVDVRLMAGEGLLADGVANIPKLKKNYEFVRGVDINQLHRKVKIGARKRFLPLLKRRRRQRQKFYSQGSG